MTDEIKSTAAYRFNGDLYAQETVEEVAAFAYGGDIFETEDDARFAKVYSDLEDALHKECLNFQSKADVNELFGFLEAHKDEILEYLSLSTTGSEV